MAEKLGTITSNLKTANIVAKKLSTCSNLRDDLKDIYLDQFLTDIIIETETSYFPVHKIVLCARSPVFKEMFSNDIREENLDIIHVDELDDHTVHQMLLFLYYDTVENLQLETASKLYVAANKYKIEKLKLICSSFFIENLSASTVDLVWILSNSHNDTDLKNVVEEFNFENKQKLLGSEKLGKLMKALPALAQHKSGKKNLVHENSKAEKISSYDFSEKNPPPKYSRRVENSDYSNSTLNNPSSASNFGNYRSGRHQQREIIKFPDGSIQNIALKSFNFSENSDMDLKTYNVDNTSYSSQQKQEASIHSIKSDIKKSILSNSLPYTYSIETRKRGIKDYLKDSGSINIKNDTSIVLKKKRKTHKRQKDNFLNISPPDNGYSENSANDSETDKLAQKNCLYNERHDTLENYTYFMTEQYASRDLNRRDKSTMNMREMNYQKMSISERTFNNSQSTATSFHGVDYFIQGSKNQNNLPEKISSEKYQVHTETGGFDCNTYPHIHNKSAHGIYQQKFKCTENKNILQETICREKHGMHRDNDNTDFNKYPYRQRQESFKNSQCNTIKQRGIRKLDNSDEFSETGRTSNLPKMRSQIMHHPHRTFRGVFAERKIYILGFCILPILCFLVYNGYLSILHKNEQFNVTTVVKTLRSEFGDQPNLTFSIIGNALKNVIMTQSKSPAIILLLAINGSKTVCSDFAGRLIDLISVPKYTVKISGADYELADSRHTKMRIDHIISHTLKLDRMGSVLIDDVDHIPGQAAIIFHKYYDHENAPFKKAVFVMTANYNRPISDYHDLRVWHRAAIEHLHSAWADTGIDQLSPLLSRLVINVAVITSETFR